ncbi:GD10573 [Drosophila simulans]|uniref:GD10573 n=1 Tax=Drosophila simulans TaxID=7240 RepID=B4QFT7_DROSI|nr:GD10573 [Drosophila simulans]
MDMDMDVAVDVAPLSDPRDPDIPHSAHVPVDGQRIRWKVAGGWRSAAGGAMANGRWLRWSAKMECCAQWNAEL